MAGSRRTDAAYRVPNLPAGSGNAALRDEIFLDRLHRYGGHAPPKSPPLLKERLGHIIDAEIIPRLILRHKQGGRAGPGAPAPIDIAAQIEEFTELVLRHDVEVIVAYVKSLLSKGVELEALLVKLLAPTARRLGQMWDADAIDFVDVTIGTSRLQQILHHFAAPARKDGGRPGRRVLLLPTPTEEHTFGLLMVSEFFRRQGWDVWGGTPASGDELPALVADQWFAIIGFSLSCERLLDSLCSTIEMVRCFSRNRSVQIVVGGRVFIENAGLKDRIGADLAVADGGVAVELAERIFQSAREWPG